jgi:fatty-acyl-CoA synthase
MTMTGPTSANHNHEPSYVSGTSDRPLLGLTIGDCLDAAASECPDREALVSCHQNLRYTYAELRAEADRIARALMALGVERGDRVGIWSLNCAEWALTQLATAKIGAILVNLNPSYRAHELEHALTQSGLSVLVLQGAYRAGGVIKSHYVDILCQLAPTLRAPSMSEDRLLECAALPGSGRWCVSTLNSPPRACGTGRSCAPSPTASPPSGWRSGRPNCSSTTRSTSSTPPAPPARPRG